MNALNYASGAARGRCAARISLYIGLTMYLAALIIGPLTVAIDRLPPPSQQATYARHAGLLLMLSLESLGLAAIPPLGFAISLWALRRCGGRLAALGLASHAAMGLLVLGLGLTGEFPLDSGIFDALYRALCRHGLGVL